MYYDDLKIIIDLTSVYFIKTLLNFIIEIAIQNQRPILA